MDLQTSQKTMSSPSTCMGIVLRVVCGPHHRCPAAVHDVPMYFLSQISRVSSTALEGGDLLGKLHKELLIDSRVPRCTRLLSVWSYSSAFTVHFEEINSRFDVPALPLPFVVPLVDSLLPPLPAPVGLYTAGAASLARNALTSAALKPFSGVYCSLLLVGVFARNWLGPLLTEEETDAALVVTSFPAAAPAPAPVCTLELRWAHALLAGALASCGVCDSDDCCCCCCCLGGCDGC